jgi:hypothetical protein
MKNKIIVKFVKAICKLANEDFLFILTGVSSWSTHGDTHIKSVVNYHKANENKI